MPDQDKYGGETGLIDNFTITVEKSEFTNDIRYNNGATLLLKWTGTVVTEDGEVLEDRSEQFSCGNGWSTPDGVTAVHENGKTKFNNSSIVQRMVDRCVKELGKAEGFGAQSPIPAMDSNDATDLGSRNAEIWTGLQFRMRQEIIKFGKDMEDKTRVMPCEFLGVGGAPATAAPSAGAAVPPPVAAAPAPAAPAAAPAAAPSTNGGGGNEVLLAQLRGLAAQTPDHQAFKDAAMAQFPAILEPANEVVLTQVIAADGIFAAAHA